MSRQISDGIDLRRDQWASELPDLDTRPMAILGRMRLITLASRPTVERVFAAHGLDTGEFDVIATLLRNGAPYEMRPTELFKSLMISSGGLTDRLARLAKRGLIERLPAPGDARSLLVKLTPEGRQLAERIFREDMAAEAQFLDGLSAEDAQRLEQLLRKLLHAVEMRANGAMADNQPVL
jgi:DNA-binding MarR family transcriptional regulator